MSRIGKRVLSIPENVNVNVEGSTVTVKGPKGELSLELVKNIAVKVEDGTVTVEPLKDDKFTHAMHGTTNANIRNSFYSNSIWNFHNYWMRITCCYSKFITLYIKLITYSNNF